MMKIFSLSAVVLLTLVGCSETNSRVVTRLNQEAAFAGDLPANPLDWRVITSGIDRRDATMYTLFGNDVAVEHARKNAQHNYPVGSMLALVTWKQQEDVRWFGGQIPAAPASVEFLTVRAEGDHGPLYSYRNFAGTPLKELSVYSGTAPNERAAYMLLQRAAVMP